MGCSASAAVSGSAIATPSPATRAQTDYQLGDKIGKGSYAQVHLATSKKQHISSTSNTEVAVKLRVLHPKKAKSSEAGKALKASLSEVKVWKAVGNHANCVQLLDSFFDDHFSYMVMEKCACSLFQYLRGAQVVNEGVMAKAFQEMLSGISHMHSVGIVHRDVKPDNFLVAGKSNTVKICDFGLSAKLPEVGRLAGVVGTAPYMPPEMLATQQSDEKADVWSFGVVAYLLLCGEFPYETPDGSARMMKVNILHGKPVECDQEWLSDKAAQFLKHVLTRDPIQRPSANQVLASSYLVDPKFDTRTDPVVAQVLTLAKRTGAFGSESLKSLTEADQILRQLQQGSLENLSRKSLSDSNVDTTLQETTTMLGKETLNSWESTTSTSAGSSPYPSELVAYSSKASSAVSASRM